VILSFFAGRCRSSSCIDAKVTYQTDRVSSQVARRKHVDRSDDGWTLFSGFWCHATAHSSTAGSCWITCCTDRHVYLSSIRHVLPSFGSFLKHFDACLHSVCATTQIMIASSGYFCCISMAAVGCRVSCSE